MVGAVMITIKLTVPDGDHAASIIDHLMTDVMLDMALPITIEIKEEEETDPDQQSLDV